MSETLSDQRLAGVVPMDMRPKTPTKERTDTVPPVTRKRQLGHIFDFGDSNAPPPLKLVRKDDKGINPLTKALDEHLKEEEALWAAKRKMLRLTAKALDAALVAANNKHEEAIATILKEKFAPILKELAVGGPEKPPKVRTENAKTKKEDQRPTDAKDKAAKEPTRGRSVPPVPTRAASRPRTGKATWAEVAKDPQPQATAASKDWTVVGSKQEKKRGASKAPPAALRAFIRLPEDHPWRNMTAVGVRKEMANITGMSLARITEAKEVRTGWSIKVDNAEAMKYLTAPIPAYAREGLKIEREEEWHAYFVPKVPRTFRDLTGEKPISHIVANEAQAKAKAKEPPQICKPAANNTIGGTQDWIVVFREKVKEGFRLFGASGPAKEMHRSPSIHQCSGCWGYHDQGVCNKEERCGQCGNKAHGACDKPPQCANCLGPHKSESKLCKARPEIEKGKIRRPTKAQLKGIKKLGLASYEAAHGQDNKARGKTKEPAAKTGATPDKEATETAQRQEVEQNKTSPNPPQNKGEEQATETNDVMEE